MILFHQYLSSGRTPGRRKQGRFEADFTTKLSKQLDLVAKGQQQQQQQSQRDQTKQQSDKKGGTRGPKGKLKAQVCLQTTEIFTANLIYFVIILVHDKFVPHTHLVAIGITGVQDPTAEHHTTEVDQIDYLQFLQFDTMPNIY